MRLAFVFDVQFPRFNGDYYAINLTPKLWQTRYLQVFDEIVVVGRTEDVTREQVERMVRSNSEKVTFRCIQDVPRIQRIFNLMNEEAFIEEAIKDCDAVILRSWWGVKACRKLNKPYMIEVVNCALDSLWNHSLLGKLFALPSFLMQKKAIYQAPYVMYVTKFFLQKRYPSNGITASISDVELPERQENRILENRLERIHSSKEKTVLGTAGAVNVSYKGQRYVIQALALLKKEGIDNVEYQIAGSGDCSALKAWAKTCGVEEQVHFVGSIPHDQMFSWYDQIDVYIQSSLTEGLPRAVVEAMSRGLPCIGTNAGGIPELIEAEYICDKKSNLAVSFANAIRLMTAERMVDAATRNYSFSKQFNTDKLNMKRVDFLEQFRKTAI